MQEIKVNQQDYTESKLKCQKCDDQLLLFVHKNNKQQTVTLGCGFCGYVNEIKLSVNEIKLREGDNNE